MALVLGGQLSPKLCSAYRRKTNAKQEEIVVFRAQSPTDVRLDFQRDPFVPQQYTYYIEAGRNLPLEVQENADGEYRYEVACGNFEEEAEGREDAEVEELDAALLAELLEELEEILEEIDLTDPIMIFIES